MNKIKFFTGTDLQKVGQEINEWLTSNRYFLVNASTQRNTLDGILVTVVYNTMSTR